MELYTNFDLNKYVDELKNIEVNAKQIKYKKIQNIIEQMLMIECKSLYDFPPIYIDKITENEQYIKKILNNNFKIIVDIFNGNFDEIIKLTDETKFVKNDNMRQNILTFFRKLLNKIDYSLVLKNINTRQFYVIKRNM